MSYRRLCRAGTSEAAFACHPSNSYIGSSSSHISPMKIYTKTGDKGETSLFGGQRVPKDALRIEAYGTIDELNSALGVVLATTGDERIREVLTEVQNQLFGIGADLATPRLAGGPKIRRIEARDSRQLEKTIDSLEPLLKPLRSFILPGGSPVAARIHLARTVCRRAERSVVRLSRNEDIGG